jgi:hypothetical protein
LVRFPSSFGSVPDSGLIARDLAIFSEKNVVKTKQ